MAIAVTNIQLSSGILVESAYARIDNLNGGKRGIVIVLLYFIDQEASDAGGVPIIQKGFSFVPSVEEGASDFIKQGYEYIKTLPEFAGAIDA